MVSEPWHPKILSDQLNLSQTAKQIMLTILLRSILSTAPTCMQQFVCYSSFLRHVCGAKHPGPGVNVAHISNMKNSKQIDLQ